MSLTNSKKDEILAYLTQSPELIRTLISETPEQKFSILKSTLQAQGINVSDNEINYMLDNSDDLLSEVEVGDEILMAVAGGKGSTYNYNASDFNNKTTNLSGKSGDTIRITGKLQNATINAPGANIDADSLGNNVHLNTSG